MGASLVIILLHMFNVIVLKYVLTCREMKWYYFGNLGLLKCVNVDHGICRKAFFVLDFV